MPEVSSIFEDKVIIAPPWSALLFLNVEFVILIFSLHSSAYMAPPKIA
jgi:hypothetical protein